MPAFARARAAAGGAALVVTAVVAATLAAGADATTAGATATRGVSEAGQVYYKFIGCRPYDINAFIFNGMYVWPEGTTDYPAAVADFCAATDGCVAGYVWHQDNYNSVQLYNSEAFADGGVDNVGADLNDGTYAQRCCAGTCDDAGGGAVELGNSVGQSWAQISNWQPYDAQFFVVIAAAAPPTCDDGVQNQDETGVDCGGQTCDPCATGEACTVDGDCASDICLFGATAAATGTCVDADAANGDACPGVGVVKRAVGADGRRYLISSDGEGDADFRIGGTNWYILATPEARGLVGVDCSAP